MKGLVDDGGTEHFRYRYCLCEKHVEEYFCCHGCGSNKKQYMTFEELIEKHGVEKAMEHLDQDWLDTKCGDMLEELKKDMPESTRKMFGEHMGKFGLEEVPIRQILPLVKSRLGPKFGVDEEAMRRRFGASMGDKEREEYFGYLDKITKKTESIKEKHRADIEKKNRRMENLRRRW